MDTTDQSDLWRRLVRYYATCVDREGSFSDLISRSGTGKKYVFPPLIEEAVLCGIGETVHLDGAGERLAEAAQARGDALLYGYPLMVYEEPHQTPSGRVTTKREMAPLLVVELTLPPLGRPIPADLRPSADPGLHPEVTSRLGYKQEEVASLLDAYPIEPSRGTHQAMTEYLSNLIAELGIDQVSEVDPTALDDEDEGKIAGAGLHNVAVLYRAKTAIYHQRLLAELVSMADQWPEASKTAARFVIEQSTDTNWSVSPTQIIEPLPLNDAQRVALSSAMSAPLTLVTGPPGTGKSQLVAAAAASCWASGQSVLVASTNNQAVDVATARGAEVDAGLLIRTGSRERREKANEQLRLVSSRNTSHADEAVLELALGKARKALDETRAAVKQRTADESALAEASLGIEILGKPLHVERADQLKGEPPRLLRKGRRLEKARFFGNVRRKRFLESLGLPLPSFRDLLDFLELAVTVQEITGRISTTPAMQTLYRTYLEKVAAVHEAGCATVRATVSRAVRAGLQPLRNFTWARPSYGNFDALQNAFTKLLPHVRGWATTALSAGSTFPLQPALFDLVIIDEASQCSIPNILPILFRGRRAMIIGDPNQLQHIATLGWTADQEIARDLKLDLKLLSERKWGYTSSSSYAMLANNVEHVHLLDEHYRSHPDIIGVSNKLFYQGALTVLTDPARLLVKRAAAIAWVDVVGECHRPDSGSLLNRREAEAVADEVSAVAMNDQEASLGVVTPFSAQARLIGQLLDTRLSPDVRERANLMVGTAHRFQGDERDVMFFSPTAAPGLRENTLRWMSATPNLLNVAITRARSYLVVVGHRGYCCEADGVLGEFARAVRDLELEEEAEVTAFDGLLHSEAERRLYQAFRQVRIDPVLKRRVCGYECDFYLETESTAINIECDGVQHLDQAARQRIQDLSRDDLLRIQGVEVLRVPAWRCIAEPAVVVGELSRAIQRLS